MEVFCFVGIRSLEGKNTGYGSWKLRKLSSRGGDSGCVGIYSKPRVCVTVGPRIDEVYAGGVI